MDNRTFGIVKLAAAGAVLALAVLRAVFYRSLAVPMDSIFFMLLGVALVLLIVPFERLRSLKAGAIELSLDSPQVQRAIAGLGLDSVGDERIRSQLAAKEAELQWVRGSRILWIDDHPNLLVGYRRLLRALGATVVAAPSSTDAERTLNADSDFDLIVTDVQREGRQPDAAGQVGIHDGVDFIVKLRTSHADMAVQNMPVLFYSAYLREKLMDLTRPARELRPEPEVASWERDDLLPKVIAMLAEARAHPIKIYPHKVATMPKTPHGTDPGVPG